jgi:hypothetical protein
LATKDAHSLYAQFGFKELAALHANNAVDHPFVMEPLHGRAATGHMPATEFGRAEMTCMAENIVEDGKGAILEWRGPQGLRLLPAPRTTRSPCSAAVSTNSPSSGGKASPWRSAAWVPLARLHAPRRLPSAVQAAQHAQPMPLVRPAPRYAAAMSSWMQR